MTRVVKLFLSEELPLDEITNGWKTGCRQTQPVSQEDTTMTRSERLGEQQHISEARGNFCSARKVLPKSEWMEDRMQQQTQETTKWSGQRDGWSATNHRPLLNQSYNPRWKLLNLNIYFSHTMCVSRGCTSQHSHWNRQMRRHCSPQIRSALKWCF